MTMIREIVRRDIDTHIDDRRCNDKRIIKRYKTASKPAKQDIDDIFIALCGWPLEKVINRWRAINGK